MKVVRKIDGTGPYALNIIYDCEIIISNNIIYYYIPCPEADVYKNVWSYSKLFDEYYFKKYFKPITELRKEKLKKLNEKIS